VNGLILVGVGEGILLGFAYGILDLPHPALLGALSAMLATIPFGAPLVFGAGALVLLVEGNTVGAVALFAFGSVVTFVADHFVRPALIGGTTRLPFILVLLGILGGIETMGLIGLFLGPAIMAAFVALWRDFAGSGDAPKRLD
jgi:predicted PurR-regulated permease PerM